MPDKRKKQKKADTPPPETVQKIKPFSSFCQYIKNSVIDGYNTVIDSKCFTIILSLTTI